MDEQTKFKDGDRVRDLIRAAALIEAEIERLDRRELTPAQAAMDPGPDAPEIIDP